MKSKYILPCIIIVIASSCSRQIEKNGKWLDYGSGMIIPYP